VLESCYTLYCFNTIQCYTYLLFTLLYTPCFQRTFILNNQRHLWMCVHLNNDASGFSIFNRFPSCPSIRDGLTFQHLHVLYDFKNFFSPSFPGAFKTTPFRKGLQTY